MTTVSFPNWSEALDAANLPEKALKTHRVIIQWFLGYLGRERKRASVHAARAFVEHLIETRKPEDWQVEQWRNGLNWFFKEAPMRMRAAGGDGRRQGERRTEDEGISDDGRRRYAHTVAEAQERVPMDPWYDEAVRLMRVRHMAYRTEETYLGWIRRMEKFLQEKGGLETFEEEDLKRFLSYLAAGQGCRSGAGETVCPGLERRQGPLRAIAAFAAGVVGVASESSACGARGGPGCRFARSVHAGGFGSKDAARGAAVGVVLGFPDATLVAGPPQ